MLFESKLTNDASDRLSDTSEIVLYTRRCTDRVRMIILFIFAVVVGQIESSFSREHLGMILFECQPDAARLIIIRRNRFRDEG